MTEGTVARIESFERARGSLVNALTNVAHATDRALTDLEVGVDRGQDAGGARAATSRTSAGRRATRRGWPPRRSAQLDESMRDLVELIGAALFERDRLRILLNVLGEIDGAADEASLPPHRRRRSPPSCSTPTASSSRIDRDGVLVPAAQCGRARRRARPTSGAR